jgi:putative NADH-flavin reductase
MDLIAAGDLIEDSEVSIMKIAVFGATGGTGAATVRLALARGHQVTAFGRSTQQLAKLSAAGAATHSLDVLDADAVVGAVQEYESVICALGASPSDKSKVRARGTQNILEAMAAGQIRRFVCVSALGCGDSRSCLPFHYKHFVVPLLLKHVYADHTAQEENVRASNLDWTIVRPAVLTESACQYHVWVGDKLERSVNWKIGRENVADLVLNEIEEPRYIGSAVCLSCVR